MMKSKMTSPGFMEILEAIENGKNILLIGSGGTGKSLCLRVICKIMEEDHNYIVGMTATTGIAALNIKGSTLHRWAGLGLATGPIERLVLKVSDDPEVVKRIKECKILIIDEISMLGYELIEKIDWVFKIIRNNEEVPFGGIQVIFSGDFLQLPPVKDHWPFLHKRWKELELEPFVLEEARRYTDMKFFRMLLRIREGKHTLDDIKILRGRFEAYKTMMKERENDNRHKENKCAICLEDFESEKKPNRTDCGHFFHHHCLNKWVKSKENCPTCRQELKIRPTILYSKKVDVSRYNLKELEKCQSPTFMFHAEDSIHSLNPGHIEFLSEKTKNVYSCILDESIPSLVALRIGAQVMLKANISVAESLVNGSRGVVIDLVKTDEEQYAIVKFMDGKERKIGAWTWDRSKEEIYAVRSQIPLILAYALTIHQVQGCTIDCVICDLGHSVFAYGQAYVALSRVRCLEGLYLSNFVSKAITTDQVALKFHREQIQKQNKREKVDFDCIDENGNPMTDEEVLTEYIKRFRILD